MKLYIYILALILFVSCYEDKGNYDYEPINKVLVGLDEIYSYRLDKDTTVTITPRLSQSLQESKNHLKYIWLHSTTNHNFYGHGKFDTVSVEENLNFHIDPNEAKLSYEHYFRLNVFDELTGIEYPVNTTIKLVKPYDGAWMILHDRNGQAELGAVEYLGNKIDVTHDAYYKETGKRFQGKPLCLGNFRTTCKYYGGSANMFSIITDQPREAGVYCQWKKFQKMDSLERMVAPTIRSTFDYQHVKMIDAGASWGAFCISDGVFYQIPIAMKIYKAPVASDLTGDMDVTLGAKVGFSTLLYDQAGHRFCFYHNTNRKTTYDSNIFSEANDNPTTYPVKPVPLRDGNVSGVDPNQLPSDQKMLYVGAGYQFEDLTTGFYGYGVAVKGQDSCFVYEINMRGLLYADYPSFSGYYGLKMPQGLDENSCFASTRPYSGIIFYASGNKVYRLDFKQAGGKATLVYTHTGGKAMKMKFARKGTVEDDSNGDSLYPDYEFDLNQSLGVAFDMGNGKSDFVILNLSATGTVGADSENYPAKQIYSDFGEIKDFLFL